jgi:hypothetical protein
VIVRSALGRPERACSLARLVSMRHALAFGALAFGIAPAWAYDGFTSEASHAVAGAAMAAAGTAIADHWGVEHRAWVGFGASSLLGLFSETLQVASNHQSSLRSAGLDVGSNMLGAAIGAWGTDRYLLKPAVTRDAGHTTMGFALQGTF